MNNAQAAAVSLLVAQPLSTNKGDKNIPPPTPTNPETRPIPAPLISEIIKGGGPETGLISLKENISLTLAIASVKERSVSKIQSITGNKAPKKENAIELLNNIKSIKIEFTKEADDKDQLYGAISKKEIINFFVEKDIKLISDDLKIINPIRSLGEHDIEISPYDGLSEKLKVIIKKA